MAKKKTRSGQYPLRLPDDLRLRIEKAAKGRNISLNAAILERLEQSFQTESRFGGQRLVEVIEAIAVVMRSTGRHAEYYETSKHMSPGKWMDMPFPFDQAVQGANAILERYRPPGKIIVPERTVDEVMGHETKVDPDEAARISRTFARLGKRIADEALRREQDDE